MTHKVLRVVKPELNQILQLLLHYYYCRNNNNVKINDNII